MTAIVKISKRNGPRYSSLLPAASTRYDEKEESSSNLGALVSTGAQRSPAFSAGQLDDPGNAVSEVKLVSSHSPQWKSQVLKLVLTDDGEAEIGASLSCFRPLYPWLVLGGAFISILWFLLILLTYNGGSYFAWVKSQKAWAKSNHLVDGFVGKLNSFILLGLPLLPLFLCGIVYSEKFLGFASIFRRGPAVTYLNRIVRLRRSRAVLGTWVSLLECMVLLSLVCLAMIWVVRFVSHRQEKARLASSSPIVPISLAYWARGFGKGGLLFLFLLLFPVVRDAFWLDILGASPETAVKYHRWLGRLLIAFANIHGLLFFYSWARDGTVWENAFPFCYFIPHSTSAIQEVSCRITRHQVETFAGLVACCFLNLMCITSLHFVRRKFYDVFLWSHNFLFLLALLALAMHEDCVLYWLYPALLFSVVSRTRSWVRTGSNVRVRSFELFEDVQIFKLELEMMPRLQHCEGYTAGQYVLLTFPEVTKSQAHSFSISSAPKDSSSLLTVHGKACGDWTRDVLAYLKTCRANSSFPLVKVDGYFGCRRSYRDCRHLVLLAGGIGVTPLISVLKDLYHHHSQEIPSRPARILFHWAVGHIAETEPFRHALEEVASLQDVFSINIYVTKPSSESQLLVSDVAAQGSTVGSSRLGSPPSAHHSDGPPSRTEATLPSFERRDIDSGVPFDPVRLGCYSEVKLHFVVWAASFLSVTALWYITLSVNAVTAAYTRTEERKAAGEAIPWYVIQMMEPVCFLSSAILAGRGFLRYYKGKNSSREVTATRSFALSEVDHAMQKDNCLGDDLEIFVDPAQLDLKEDDGEEGTLQQRPTYLTTSALQEARSKRESIRTSATVTILIGRPDLRRLLERADEIFRSDVEESGMNFRDQWEVVVSGPKSLQNDLRRTLHSFPRHEKFNAHYEEFER